MEVAEAHEEMESVHEELATKRHALVEKDGTIRDLHSEIATKQEELKVLEIGFGFPWGGLRMSVRLGENECDVRVYAHVYAYVYVYL